MSADQSASLVGRRLPDSVLGESGEGWGTWEDDRRPGDYMKVETGRGAVYWYVADPVGEIGTITKAHHVVIEHEDGTISVQPSIVSPVVEGGVPWHGYLNRGVWTGC